MRQIFQHAKDNYVTWVMIAMIMAIIAVITTSITLISIRPSKIDLEISMPRSITGKTLVSISEKSQKELTKFMNNNENVIAVQVARANLIKNERSSVFFRSKNPEMQALWNRHQSLLESTFPLFSTGSKFNDRVATLFSGNYDCREFKRTIAYTIIPNGNTITPWICSIAIPPAFDNSGDFAGFLTFYLSEEPTVSDKKYLADKSAAMAVNIYYNDVKRAQ